MMMAELIGLAIWLVLGIALFIIVLRIVLNRIGIPPVWLAFSIITLWPIAMLLLAAWSVKGILNER